MRYTDPSDLVGEDMIDSRDLIEYGNELASRLEEGAELDESEVEALEAINALAGEGIEDWQYGATLIHEDYFTEYAEQLADDVGAISRDASWPLMFIDWEAAADCLKQDYIVVSFLGRTYYAR